MRIFTLMSLTVTCSVACLTYASPIYAYPNAQPASQPTSQRVARPNAPASRPGVHPSSQPTSAGSQKTMGGFIYGQLTLDDAVKDKVKAGSVVFVIVRRSVTQGKGMLIAATKLDGVTKGSFPLKYVVKQSDAMMGAPLIGKVTVSARIDQDGDAISKQAGDIIGEAEKAVMVGVNPVVINLNQPITNAR